MNLKGYTGMKWALKICAKLLMARLPVSYRLWKSVGVFRHGCMDGADYSFKVFNLHAERAYPKGFPQEAVVLELGPGDSIASAIIACARGVSRTYMVDVGSFVSRDVAFYQALVASLKQRGLNPPDLTEAKLFEDVLYLCNAGYMTHGLASLKQIPSNSVDFVMSHSVFEHVRKHELLDVMKETHRILKPNAFASHNIDYQDHLSRALNNLRFSDRVWESSLFAQSGFYTNRIPAVTMHAMFRAVGFKIEREEFGAWPQLPTPRIAMHSDFQAYSDEELINRTSHVLLRK
jgi:SAM-dependent methyltransferase